MLLRQRVFHDVGIDMPLVTFAPQVDYEEIRIKLVADGLMHPESQILNLWDWLLEHADEFPESPNEFFHLPTGNLTSKTYNRGDNLWSTIYRDSTGKLAARDYFYADDTLAIHRIYPRANTDFQEPSIQVLNRAGRVVRHFGSAKELKRFWIEALAGDSERVFLLSDSRRVIADFLNMNERFFTLSQMHNPHNLKQRHFLSPVQHTYQPIMDYYNDLDALCVLTDRQKSDIARRFGMTDNIYVIENPIDLAPPTDNTTQRSDRLIVTMGRMHRQKRLDRAIKAFAHLLKQIPDARFDIYGTGKLEGELTQLINKLGINHAVTLRGYDPRAREALKEATCYWVTSEYEGYPLATLEAMSQGCPVVAYDVKYGLREQIENGVNGFIVESNDLRQLVDRTIEIMNNPTLAQALSTGAIRTATSHSPEKFLHDTAQVLQSMIAKKKNRTFVSHRELIESKVNFAELNWGKRFTKDFSLQATITADVRGSTLGQSLTESDFQLDLVSPQSELVPLLPIQVAQDGNLFTITADLDSQFINETIQSLGSHVETLWIRVGFSWRNSAWIQPVTPEIRVVLDKHGKPRALARPKLFSVQHLRKRVAKRLRRSLYL